MTGVGMWTMHGHTPCQRTKSTILQHQPSRRNVHDMPIFVILGVARHGAPALRPLPPAHASPGMACSAACYDHRPGGPATDNLHRPIDTQRFPVDTGIDHNARTRLGVSGWPWRPTGNRAHHQGIPTANRCSCPRDKACRYPGAMSGSVDADVAGIGSHAAAGDLPDPEQRLGFPASAQHFCQCGGTGEPIPWGRMPWRG